MPYARIEEKYASQEQHRQRNKNSLQEYLHGKSCVDCGNGDIRVLEFDHVRGNKKFGIGKAVSGSTRSWASILKEIEKCDIRCANCHRIRTQEEGSHWRSGSLSSIG